MKKILMTTANLFPPKGGAEKSFFSFAKELSKDFDVTILAPDKNSRIREEFGYQIITQKMPFFIKYSKSYIKLILQILWWEKVLKKFFRNNKFDLLIHQGVLSQSTNKLNIKKINFVRGTGFFCSAALKKSPVYYKTHTYFWGLPNILKIQYPLVRYFQKKGLRSIRNSEIVISNSEFMKEVVKFYIGRGSFVIYPPIEFKNYQILENPEKRKFILFVNPTIHKGVKMMYKIAKNLSDKKFLVVGKTDISGKKWYKLLKNLPNTKIIEYIKDMKKIYKEARLLVSPVEWYEPFGRTPAEAMVNGIPSIVSDKGGLPEVVGNAGDLVKNTHNFKEWVKEIKKYDDKRYYEKKSELCLKRIKRFSSENQYKKLKKIINENL